MNDTTGWNRTIADLSGAHILQTEEWGAFKAEYGWQVLHKTWKNSAGELIAAAQILKKKLRIGKIHLPFSILYIPRGPMMDFSDIDHVRLVSQDLKEIARQEQAIQIKIEPELFLDVPWNLLQKEEILRNHPGLNLFVKDGWNITASGVQFRNTVWLDLSDSEEHWLKRMKQKNRYNLRLAAKKDVLIVRASEKDLETLFHLYAETSLRDRFTIRNADYYLSVWKQFIHQGKAVAFMAVCDDIPVAGLVLYYFAGRAWYLYGMSGDQYRDRMPNYLLQWEAMRFAKSQGCVIYDLWGAPDQFDESDPMWGVYRFKLGLGGVPKYMCGALDYSPCPWLYSLYEKVMPAIMKRLRRRGNREIRQFLAN